MIKDVDRCSVKGCRRKVCSRSMCRTHSKEFPANPERKACSVYKCRRHVRAANLTGDAVTDCYCQNHYENFLLYDSPIKPKDFKLFCYIEGCHKPVIAKMVCKTHYDQQRWKTSDMSWTLSESLADLVQITRIKQRRADRLARKHQIAPCW